MMVRCNLSIGTILSQIMTNAHHNFPEPKISSKTLQNPKTINLLRTKSLHQRSCSLQMLDFFAWKTIRLLSDWWSNSQNSFQTLCSCYKISYQECALFHISIRRVCCQIALPCSQSWTGFNTFFGWSPYLFVEDLCASVKWMCRLCVSMLCCCLIENRDVISP